MLFYGLCYSLSNKDGGILALTISKSNFFIVSLYTAFPYLYNVLMKIDMLALPFLVSIPGGTWKESVPIK